MDKSIDGFAIKFLNNLITPDRLILLICCMVPIGIILGGAITRIAMLQEQLQKDMMAHSATVKDLTNTQNTTQRQLSELIVEVKKNQEFASLLQQQNGQTHRDILLALQQLNR